MFWASPLASRLAKVTGRIEFTCVADESFASGCSPPRFAATQLPSATRSQTSPRRGLPPRIYTTITGARVPPSGGSYASDRLKAELQPDAVISKFIPVSVPAISIGDPRTGLAPDE